MQTNIDEKIEEIFEAATNFVRAKVQQISKENLLYFYARYKQATEGSCDTDRPSGLFNFEAKSKWDGKEPVDYSLKKSTKILFFIKLSKFMQPDLFS